MYLHAGNNKSILLRDIVGIFDMDTSTVSSETKKFLKSKEKKGFTETIVNELPKSYILTKTGEVIFSQISTTSLMGRI